MSQTPNASESWSCKVGRGFTRMSFTYDQFGGIYATPGDTMQEQNTQPQITEVDYDAIKVAAAVNKVYVRFNDLKAAFGTHRDITAKEISDDGKRFFVAVESGGFHNPAVVAVFEGLNELEKKISIDMLMEHPPAELVREGIPTPDFTVENVNDVVAKHTAQYKEAGELLSNAKGEKPKTAVINGVEVMALKDVETPDGVKPFADGNIVGVFDQAEPAKSIEERLGQPDEFITKALRKAGVKDPEAWKGGMMTVWTDPKIDIKQRIFHINQQLRLYIAEIAVDHSSTIQPRATIVDGVPVEDWYKIISAGILKYMADLMIEHQERVAKAAATATA